MITEQAVLGAVLYETPSDAARNLERLGATEVKVERQPDTSWIISYKDGGKRRALQVGQVEMEC